MVELFGFCGLTVVGKVLLLRDIRARLTSGECTDLSQSIRPNERLKELVLGAQIL